MANDRFYPDQIDKMARNCQDPTLAALVSPDISASARIASSVSLAYRTPFAVEQSTTLHTAPLQQPFIPMVDWIDGDDITANSSSFESSYESIQSPPANSTTPTGTSVSTRPKTNSGSGLKRKYQEWTKELDQRLELAVRQLGCPSNVRKISRAPSDSIVTWNEIGEAVGRSGKQCRERWMNHLCMKNRRIAPWSEDEWQRLELLADKHGKQWSKFVPFFPGRSSLDLRNKWFSRQRSLKRCAQQDWRTPLLTLELDPSKTDLEPLPLGNSTTPADDSTSIVTCNDCATHVFKVNPPCNLRNPENIAMAWDPNLGGSTDNEGVPPPVTYETAGKEPSSFGVPLQLPSSRAYGFYLFSSSAEPLVGHNPTNRHGQNVSF